MVLTLASADPAPAEEGEADGEGTDTPAETTSETPRVEPKGEAKLDAPLKLEPAAKAEAPPREVRLDTHNVVRELANRIELMAAAKSQQGVIVHLQPLDLGSITLLVKPESGGVSAEIGASNDQVRQALAQSQPQLSRHLELRGLTVTNVSVSAETSNRDSQRQPSSQQQHPSFSSSAQSGHSALPRASQYGSPDPVARRSPSRATGVDLWI
jgi:flagellar hook-length control protein FliK